MTGAQTVEPRPGDLSADLRLRRTSSFSLDVQVTLLAGRTAALLGPNGAGKSSVVAALAGLVAVDAGRISLGGRTLDNAADGTFVEPADRRVGVVFQDPLLFPHMSALDNVAFGGRSAGMTRRQARARAAEWMARLGIEDVARRRPAELSGGQAQRVALARALASNPDVLLLDEPLSALDVTTRGTMRSLLASHLGDFAGPRLLITHDPHEAFALADDIHVLEGGRITQSGSVDDLLLRPRTSYAADLGGSNLFTGDAQRGTVVVGGHELQIADPDMSGPVRVTIHPAAISLHRTRPDGSQRNVWETTVDRVEHLGARVRLRTGPPMALTVEVTDAARVDLDLRAGGQVWVAVKATGISLVD